jgi:hypothetical protein
VVWKGGAAPDRDFALKRLMAQVTVGKAVITDQDLPAIHNHRTAAKYNFRAESASPFYSALALDF